MVNLVIVQPVRAPVDLTWRTLTDWPAHSRWIPLTTVSVLPNAAGSSVPPGAGVGARFVGRTGVGPLAFDDPMEITQWRAPSDGVSGRCAVVKQGRLVLGTAQMEVADDGRGGSTLTWTYDVDIAPIALTRPFGALVSVLVKGGLVGSLRKMAAEAEAAAGRDA